MWIIDGNATIFEKSRVEAALIEEVELFVKYNKGKPRHWFHVVGLDDDLSPVESAVVKVVKGEIGDIVWMSV